MDDTEKTHANLRVAAAHEASLIVLNACEDTEEIWLCVLLLLGTVNSTINRIHQTEYTVPDILTVLEHYDDNVPMVAETADKLASEAVRVVN